MFKKKKFMDVSMNSLSIGKVRRLTLENERIPGIPAESF